jgi:hypothetical protein
VAKRNAWKINHKILRVAAPLVALAIAMVRLLTIAAIVRGNVLICIAR